MLHQKFNRSPLQQVYLHLGVIFKLTRNWQHPNARVWWWIRFAKLLLVCLLTFLELCMHLMIDLVLRLVALLQLQRRLLLLLRTLDSC